MGKKKKWVREKYFVVNYFTASAGFYDFEEDEILKLKHKSWIEPEEYYLYSYNDIKRIYHIKGELTQDKIESLGMIPYFEVDEIGYLKLMVKKLNS